MSRHDNIVRVFHAVKSPLAIHWKSESSSVRLSGRDTPLDGLAVIRDHDRRCLYGGYDVSLLVPENKSNIEALFLAVMAGIADDPERNDGSPRTEFKIFAARKVDGAKILREAFWVRLGLAFCFSRIACTTTERLDRRVRGWNGKRLQTEDGVWWDILGWHFVPFHRGRLRDVDIMILRNALFVEFQSNELLDLSLNTRLALGITEKETHPRVSCRKAGRWYIELLACEGGTS
jgi:hypothetical protein